MMLHAAHSLYRADRPVTVSHDETSRRDMGKPCTSKLPAASFHGQLASMSMTKRFLFGRRPEDDPRREALRAAAGEEIAGYTFRLAAKKKNAAGRPYWCPYWRSSLDKAVRQLGIHHIYINDGLMLRTEADREAVLARASQLYADRVAQPGT